MKEFKLSNQAVGAFMMALQKCILEQSDITDIMKSMVLTEVEDGVLQVLNPETIEVFKQ